MKLTLCSVTALSLVLASCSTLDPDYAEYKKKKEAEAAAGAQAPFGQAADPYGVPGGASEGGNYAPFQPLPGVNSPPPPTDPLPSFGGADPGLSPSYPTVPSTPAPAPVGPTLPHTVVKGDSLWGLAKRYNTTVESIKVANGLSSDTIQTGRTLQIPSNN